MLFDRIRPGLNLLPVKPLLASVLLLVQATPQPEAAPQHLRFRRPITAPSASQSCAVLDASVFTHASPSLKDLRLYSGGQKSGQTEVPYAITLSEPLQQDTDDARILNLGDRSGHIVFDLAMPRRPYTAIDLDLDANDFIATAQVSGSQTLEAPNPTNLGTYTLFDLTAQHLSHSTNLSLAESNFPYLHIDLSLAPAPGNTATVNTLNRPEIVKAATVPPSREAQTLYTTLQQTSTIVQRAHESVATFQLPARVPIERIAFTLAPNYKGSFSRPVRIEAHVVPGQNPDPGPADATAEEESGPTPTETASGIILSVHKHEAEREISQEILSIPTAIGANMQHFAELQVAVENGDDAPLPIAQIQLQMRQRRICFDAASLSAPLSLYYGDPTLEAPVYDYAKLFLPAAAPASAVLAPESPNPAYNPRKDTRPFTERHPELLWIVLLGVVCVLALTAFRSAKRLPK